MNTQLQKNTPKPQVINDEQILVVQRTHLFVTEAEAWQGIKRTDTNSYIHLIYAHQEFKPRSAMELNPNYKQIIPYMIFNHDNRYFLMQRRATASEQRLQNKYSLGIGGHVRQEDVFGANLMDWAQREFHEEIAYKGNLKVTTLGILNDDTNDVGRVHLGLVLLLQGDSSNITIKSELKSGQLLTLGECATYYDQLESWSQCVLTLLQEYDNNK